MNISIPVEEYIRTSCIYPDFPKEGINFIDIFPLLRTNCYKDFILFLNDCIPDDAIVVLPESRAFIFAGLIKNPSRILFLRKEGKRPGGVISIKAAKEYGENIFVFLHSDLEQIFENNPGINRIVFVDDILATGQTAKGIAEFFNNYNHFPEGVSIPVTEVISFITLKDVFDKSIFDDIPYVIDIHSFIKF